MDSTSPFQPWASDDSAKNVKSKRELVDDAKLHRENVNHPKHRQTASYSKESVSVPSIATGSSSATAPGGEPARASSGSKMDSSKIASMQQIVENTLSQEGRQRVVQLLEAVEALSGAERLLLYLRLPTGVPQHDPLKQPMNPLGSRAELQQTVTWIQTHLEVDPDVSLPKQDVYDEYIAHCMSSNMKPLSTADFGKVMKQVYPSVRPRRLGTRGNSRYCYAGLRKKIKLEVPQLPDLGESSKETSTTTSRETDRIVCDWAETKLGVKFSSISELSRHLMSAGTQLTQPGPASASPPPLTQQHAPADETASRQLLNQLKRKIQTQGRAARPKKTKSQEVSSESPPSTSYVSHHPPMKHESESIPEPGYGYQTPYMPLYEVRPPYPAYGAPPRAHPPSASHPSMPMHDYRPDPYAFEPSYAPRDLTRPADVAHNLPINLSSDASTLDLSTERGEWQRRRPPEPPPPPPPRLPLPGKKLILETYQSERSAHLETREEFPRTEYLPKKMRAAEIMGGKLTSRHAQTPEAPTTSTPAPPDAPIRPEFAFLEDPKNLTSRSKSTAAALAREEQEAASPTRSVKAPTSKSERTKLKKPSGRTSGPSPDRAETPDRPATPDSCCGLDGINIRTGMICEEKHSEILNRERVISICNIGKHDLDDYLNEGNSQEHEEELLQYFHHQRANQSDAPENASSTTENAAAFLEAGQDPHDDHSQGKNEKISQLRELLAKNLKNQSGSGSQSLQMNQESQPSEQNSLEQPYTKPAICEGAFKALSVTVETEMNGQAIHPNNKNSGSNPTENGTSVPYTNDTTSNQSVPNVGAAQLYNGHGHHEPQSPTTRTQQYDFVPISDGCHSPGNFNSKSPLSFGQRSQSPTKVNKVVIMGGSLQTSPISHSTAASPFVSPRNTPVPRSRLCPRPIPKQVSNARKRRNPPALHSMDPNSKFAIPNDQKFISKTLICGIGKYNCQPISAPPSPNILTQYKNHMPYPCSSGLTNGSNNIALNFLHNTPFRDHVNGDHPLSADPLSSEVSQFFQESHIYRAVPDTFRSQSVPLKQGIGNMGLLSYNNTPVGSVPPTPVPNEFCDFGSLADTCDISKAGLNRETLDKIYDAIDSSNDVLTNSATQSLLNSNDTLSNGCNTLRDRILADEQLTSIIPTSDDLLERSNQFNQTFPNDSAATDNVEDFLKRANSMEFDLSEFTAEKNKYINNYTSRSVPSTPLPFKRTAPNLEIDSRRSRELFAADNYSSVSNGISSKSVPSTPQFAEDRSVFSYSNRDFLINGNSVCGSSQIHETVVDSDQGLTSPLHDILREDILDPLTPALLADLDKIDGPPYVDL